MVGSETLNEMDRVKGSASRQTNTSRAARTTNGDHPAMKNDNVADQLKQIRERAHRTLADLEVIRVSTDQPILTELKMIRVSNLAVLTSLDEIEYKQNRIPSDVLDKKICSPLSQTQYTVKAI